ncbi:magnesium-protoporphyrin IX methyltransferase [Striga asiatica]|uniref:Magnesium-protoporphyrin IX methyltransferase n=1 Tax=Striga asiatica TaxID=4170 RepID=A0A5A7P8W3_STRAF|nr:magnesium-protoporphyrin IX methyltransferase [Striga asiatica]
MSGGLRLCRSEVAGGCEVGEGEVGPERQHRRGLSVEFSLAPGVVWPDFGCGVGLGGMRLAKPQAAGAAPDPFPLSRTSSKTRRSSTVVNNRETETGQHRRTTAPEPLRHRTAAPEQEGSTIPSSQHRSRRLGFGRTSINCASRRGKLQQRKEAKRPGDACRRISEAQWKAAK